MDTGKILNVVADPNVTSISCMNILYKPFDFPLFTFLGTCS